MAEIDTVEGMMTESRYFWNVVKSDPTAYNITAAQAATLNDLTTAAETALAGRTSAENALTLARAMFKAAFMALAAFFRPLRQSVKDNPATTDVQRAELHLTTGGGDDDLGDPLAVAPLILVEQTGIRQHTIRFYMPGEDSDSTKKPKGVKGCNLYLKIGDAPASLKDCSLITMDTKSPYTYVHDAENIGKQAHYIAVWVDNDDSQSPQSETFSVTITG
jgi:hypothetical protein